MKQNNGQKQVSLAGIAGSTPKEKKKFPWEWIVVAIIPIIAILSVLAFLYVIGTFDSDEGQSLPAREMVEYTVTPDTMKQNVSYFALGITGEAASDRMDAVAVMCFDRKANTISVVQLPVTTYLGTDTGFAVKTVGDVWGSPQPVAFCSSHKVQLTEEEIDNNTHIGCDALVEMRKGSASNDLIRVFNEQYGLPIDNFIVIPRNGLIQLIDGLGGVDVNLVQKVTLAEESYSSGVQTLTGEAAVTYMTTYDYKNTADSDRDRMLRQREVFSAVLQRLEGYTVDGLFQMEGETPTGIIGDLMVGRYPIRFNSTSFGKERLLSASVSAASGMKTGEAIATFLCQISQLPLENITFSILPGETATSGSSKVYSVNRQQTITLLNEQMNPYGLVLDDETVTVPQVVTKADEVDPETATLDTVAQPQIGMIEEEVE